MNTMQYDTHDERIESDTVNTLHGRIAQALTPLALPTDDLARMRARMAARIAASAAQHRGLTTLRPNDAQWQDIANGIRAWVLHDNGKSRSTLIEFTPGARMPAHRHTAHEECVVVRGSLDAGDCRVRVNDYHVAPAGSLHTSLSSAEGGMAYVRGTSVGKTSAMLREYVAGWLPTWMSNNVIKPYTINADSGTWQVCANGISIKPLFSADGGTSVMMRLDAGARVMLPAAATGREMLLLSGEAFVGDILLREGEYQVVADHAGAIELQSDTGALLFVHGSTAEVCLA